MGATEHSSRHAGAPKDRPTPGRRQRNAAAHERARGLTAALVLAVGIAACTSETTPDATTADGTTPGTEADTGATTPETDASAAADAAEQRFPDVVAAELEPDGDAWRLSATLSSPYDTPHRYADAFRVLAEDGTVLGVRELAHDHANEQPFTRSLTGLEIPDEVTRITVEGRDQTHGWGGDTVEVAVPDRDAGST